MFSYEILESNSKQFEKNKPRRVRSLHHPPQIRQGNNLRRREPHWAAPKNTGQTLPAVDWPGRWQPIRQRQPRSFRDHHPTETSDHKTERTHQNPDSTRQHYRTNTNNRPPPHAAKRKRKQLGPLLTLTRPDKPQSLTFRPLKTGQAPGEGGRGTNARSPKKNPCESCRGVFFRLDTEPQKLENTPA